MQGIYIYTPETNHVYGVAAVLYLRFLLTCNVVSPMKYVFHVYISTVLLLLLLLLVLLQIALCTARQKYSVLKGYSFARTQVL
jgi:uncharacterized protein YhhL (DUF1145 family)